VIRVQREDFDPGLELAELYRASGPTAGAVCVFVGLVRDISEGAAVSAMALEHYPGMTERELARIEAEARCRWPVTATVIVHRWGRLEPGERIVFAGATSPHRNAAFDACRFLADMLKTRAPFWKAEETDAGRRWVKARVEDNVASEAWSHSLPGKR
jgi:molybdopterin synthase catalytic subunit